MGAGRGRAEIGTGWGATTMGTGRLPSHRSPETVPKPTAAAAMATAIAAATTPRLLRDISPGGMVP